jgi:DTW domain-containing protein YfiP
VRTRAQFIVIRHVREEWKSTNTSRLAALSLPNIQLIGYGKREAAFDAEELSLPDTWLLFPGPQRPLPSSPPSRIVVLDGTWSQARRMLHRVPILRTLPRLSLPAPGEPAIRLRRPHFPEGMSTFESMIRAIALLEGEDRVRPLVEFHALWAQRVLESRGRAIH